MPLHRFICDSCGKEFRKITKDKFAQCKCGTVVPRQKINRFSSRYNSDGFYTTDHGSDEYEET